MIEVSQMFKYQFSFGQDMQKRTFAKNGFLGINYVVLIMFRVDLRSKKLVRKLSYVP